MLRASLLIAFVAALAFTPGTVEAFSFNQTHSLWQEPAHIQTGSPVYVGPVLPGYGTIAYFSDPIANGTFPSYQALCAFHASEYGYNAASDFYCVYDAKLNSTSFGTPCFGTPCSPGVGTTNIYSGNVKLYPSSSIQTTSYAALTSQLDSAWTAWWADPSQPVPANPNACSSSEPFTGLFPPRGFFPANSQSADRCNIYRNSAPPTPPAATAAISASPSSIIAGSNSSISWSSTNATSCTGTNFSTGGATSGTASVSPGSTTTYSVQCTGPGGTSPVQQATVTVTPILTASCSVSPTSVTVGESATWSTSAAGGAGAYSYAWSGTDGLTGSGASVGRAYAAAGTKTANVTVSSGGQSVSVGCANSLSVSPAVVLQSDLTADTPANLSVTAGQSVTLSVIVRNTSANSTLQPFPAMLLRADTIGGPETIVRLFKDGTALGIPSGFPGNYAETASGTYTPASAGTYYYRLCVDLDDNWTGRINESNEGNNCSGWGTVTVSNPAPTGSLTCAVSSTNPPPNTSVTYTVSPASGATGPYVWDDTQGGSYGTGTSITRLIPNAGPFSMFVSGQNVAVQPIACPSVSGVCASPSATITADRTRVREGDTIMISWTGSGVDTSCTVSGPGLSQTIPGGSCVIPNGSATPTITAQSVYRISCDGGESSAEVIVNVIPRFTEF